MGTHHLTLQERENKRISILLHNGLTLVLNDLKEEDYPFVFTSVSSVFLEGLTFDYHKYIEQFNNVYKDIPERKITIFDKALCLAMAMQKHPIVNVSKRKGKKLARMTDLKEKVIVNTVVDFLHASKYSVKGKTIEGIFDLRVFDEGHKKELKQLKSLLVEEFKKDSLDYNTCLSILLKIYARGIIYENGLDTELETKILESLKVKDNVDAYGVSVSSNNTYQEYKKKFRR